MVRSNPLQMDGRQPHWRVDAQPRAVLPERKPVVLVADDQPGMRFLLKKALELNGLDVWLAENGRDAVSLYDRHLGEVAAVILDVSMPELDGPQAYFELRELNPDVAVSFMTAYHDDFDVDQLFQKAGIHVFKKPFRLDEFVRITMKMVEEAGKMMEESGPPAPRQADLS